MLHMFYQRCRAMLLDMINITTVHRQARLLNQQAANQVASEELMTILFEWHHEHLQQRRTYQATVVSGAGLTAGEDAADSLHAYSMQALEDAAAFLSNSSAETLIRVSTLREYIQSRAAALGVFEEETHHLALQELADRFHVLETSLPAGLV